VKSKIGIIDIEMGNLYSIEKSLKFLNQNFIISSDVKNLKKCDKFILPGVGAFKSAMQKIKKKKIDKLIFSEIKKEKNFLGICLGMQLLGSKSYEFKKTDGLKLNNLNFIPFKNKINKIDFHIGFNEVKYPQNSRLFKDIPQNSDFYFVHGFYAKPLKELKCYGISKYKKKFVSSYENGNIFGVQFHPEKSQIQGISLIKNFLNL
jgi:glutamine amidotransferase